MSQRIASALLVSLFFISGCSDNNSGPVCPPDCPPLLAIETQDAVPADDILETVTWNLEWFGDPDREPNNDRLQLKNALMVMDSLEADLYALQEVTEPTLLDSLKKYMPGYEGVAASYINQDQKMAFAYNTETISNVTTSVIDQIDEYLFAGRPPFVLQFDYNHSGGSQTFMAIVIHAKCCTEPDDYDRRKAAAEALYQYLQDNHPNDFIIFMGDYNDDIDESIYFAGGSPAETPYQSFKADTGSFTIVTGELGLDGTSSTISYDDVIDHITYSNEVMPFYVDGSAEVIQSVVDYISNYGNTTSDHYPVRALIRFE